MLSLEEIETIEVETQNMLDSQPRQLILFPELHARSDEEIADDITDCMDLSLPRQAYLFPIYSEIYG